MRDGLRHIGVEYLEDALDGTDRHQKRTAGEADDPFGGRSLSDDDARGRCAMSGVGIRPQRVGIKIIDCVVIAVDDIAVPVEVQSGGGWIV